MKENIDRRTLLNRTGVLIIGGVLGGTVAKASAMESVTPAKDYFEVSADTKGKCATCAYWGGIRRVSEDSKVVLSQSLGWCNNPKSLHYQKTTTPETGPMPMKVWKKWGAL